MRVFLLISGFLSLGLGIVGAFLPVLPTTPFVLLAAFCFSKGSRRMHQWMLDSPVFGPMIRDWEDGGIIRPRAKRMATLFIVISFTFMTFYSRIPVPAKAALDLFAFCVLAFIWSRPSVKVSK